MQNDNESFNLPQILELNKPNMTFNLIKEIGKGGSSEVFHAEITETKTQVAVKLFLKKGESNSESLAFCRNEENLLLKLVDNPKICKLLDSGKLPNNPKYIFYLVLELGGRTLSSYILQNQPVPPKNIDIFFEEMVLIFSDLQSQGIFYRDIKPQNILMSGPQENLYKLIDFDVSDDLNVLLKDNPDSDLKIDLKGTPRYLSPQYKELLQNFKGGNNKVKANEFGNEEVKESSDGSEEENTIQRMKKRRQLLENKEVKKKNIGEENDNEFFHGLDDEEENEDLDQSNDEDIISEENENVCFDGLNDDEENESSDGSDDEDTISKLKTKPKIYSDEKNNKQIIILNDDLTEEFSLKILICSLKQLNKNIKAADCFNHDVFSLGLIILEMAGINIKGLNTDKKELEKSIDKFKKKYPNTKIYHFIDKMLNWDSENRYDFLQIIDALIYSYNMKLENLSENQKKCAFNCFTSKKAINPNWWTNDEELLKNYYFASNGKLSLEIPKEFLKIFLFPYERKQMKMLLKKELEENFFSENENKDKEETRILLCEILMREKEKNPKEKKHFFNVFIGMYTLESLFVYKFNKFLGDNHLDKCKYFTKFFIKKRAILKDEIEYVYRILILETSKENFQTRNQYLPGNEYYWPSFSSTSLDEASVVKFLEGKLTNSQLKKKEILFFVVKLIKNKNLNRIRIMDKSMFKNEKEVLLLPYFHFKVLHSEPIEMNFFNIKKNVCKIHVEEIDSIILDINIVWYDPNVNGSENKFYQNIIKETNDNLNIFNKGEEAIEFINEKKKYVLLISCGSDTFLNKIKENELILAVVLFIGQGKKEKNIHLMEKYTVCKAICDSIYQLLRWIPNKKHIY